jgi:hypothetical protein
MQTDEQFGSSLGARMRSELNDVQAKSDAVLPELRRRLAQRTRMVRLTVAAPVVMVAAVALLIATVGQNQPRGTPPVAHGTSSPSGAGPTSGSPRPVDAAYVIDQTEQSLGRATDYVIYLSAYFDTVDHIDTWMDPATHRYRNDTYENTAPPRNAAPPQQATDRSQQAAPPSPTEGSSPARLIGSSAAQYDDHGNLRNLLFVNYDEKTYSITAKVNGVGSVTGIDFLDPNSIRSAVQSGRVQVLGEETVDGRDTLHLRILAPPPFTGAFFDLWVDSTAFLPVQEWDYKSGLNTPDQDVMRTTYSWLPRTPDNLAHLTLTPPPGFRRT